VVLAEGTNSVVETTPEALEVVAALDGGVRLRDAVKTAAQRMKAPDTAALERRAVTIARELLELGALEIQ
jgi:hypothetical protein